MSFVIKIEDETKKEVEFELGLQILEDYLEKEIDALRSRIEIDGFRKGKAPKDVIRQKFYDELRDLAMEKLINDSYKNLLGEKDWQPVNEAKVKDIKTDDKINFTLEFETLPDFELIEYKGIELVKKKPLVDERMINTRIEQLREQYAEAVTADRPAQIDDVLIIDYQVFEGDSLIESQEKIMVEIGDRRNPEDLNRALVGMAKDDLKEFLITVNDKLLRYKVKAWEVKEKQRPILSDEFAKKLNCPNLHGLKEKVQEVLLKEQEEAVKEEMLEQISQYLIERHHFAVPESSVKEEYEKILERQNVKDSQEHWNRFKPLAEDRAKLHFILDRIARKEDIKVEEKELEDMIKLQAALLQTDFEKLKARVKGSAMGDHLEGIIRREKALKFLLSVANVIEKSFIKSPWEAK